MIAQTGMDAGINSRRGGELRNLDYPRLIVVSMIMSRKACSSVGKKASFFHEMLLRPLDSILMIPQHLSALLLVASKDNFVKAIFR